jgi:hypothetical protein
MTAVAQHTLNFFLKNDAEFRLRMAVTVDNEVVGIEFGDRLDSTDFAEVMKHRVRYLFESELSPLVEFPRNLLPLLIDPAAHNKFLFLTLGYLRKHLLLCYKYNN